MPILLAKQAIMPPPYQSIGKSYGKQKGSYSFSSSGYGKGKGKSKGKGNPKWSAALRLVADKLHRNTPEGQPICFAWNAPDDKCFGQCGMAHVCRVCFSKAHPAHSCPELTAALEKAGYKKA